MDLDVTCFELSGSIASQTVFFSLSSCVERFTSCRLYLVEHRDYTILLASNLHEKQVSVMTEFGLTHPCTRTCL